MPIIKSQHFKNKKQETILPLTIKWMQEEKERVLAIKGKNLLCNASITSIYTANVGNSGLEP